jgi:hypothetical protein
MDQADLRFKIRQLIEAGVLPKDPPVIQRSGRDSAWATQQDTFALGVIVLAVRRPARRKDR